MIKAAGKSLAYCLKSVAKKGVQKYHIYSVSIQKRQPLSLAMLRPFLAIF